MTMNLEDRYAVESNISGLYFTTQLSDTPIWCLHQGQSIQSSVKLLSRPNVWALQFSVFRSSLTNTLNCVETLACENAILLRFLYLF